MATEPVGAREYNFDGLVGPTHNYAGLSVGNVASTSNRGRVSSPRGAALEGLAKMRRLLALGVPQAVLPPQARPDPAVLRRLGFAGSDADVLAAVPDLLLARAASASSMWTANAATVAPSSDTTDGRVHLVPANLHAKFHRALEVPQTTRTLRALFADPTRFCVHDPLPAHPDWADEGAANHTRLAPDHAATGIHLFAWGRSEATRVGPSAFPARQSLEASQAVARLLHLPDDRVVFAQNTPRAVDAGVFHNDVIAVGNTRTLLLHEHAFVGQASLLDELRRRLPELVVLEIPDADCSLDDAVSTYLFNSQLVSLPDGRVVLLAPSEVRNNDRVSAVLDRLIRHSAGLSDVLVQDLRQSMRNGGGPACLRLRVVLSDDEACALGGRVRLWDGERAEDCPPRHVAASALAAWVERHYRDELALDDLRDPELLDETRTALDELTRLLDLGSLYPFQQ